MNDNNDKSSNGDKNGQGAHQFKLISVNFKEAALDSPSFRANVNHLDNQINSLEDWMNALSKSLVKLNAKLEETKQFSNSFLENLVPGFLQEGLIDQEYTTTALRVTLDNTKKRWDKNLAELDVQIPPIGSMNNIIAKSIKLYRKLRQKFDTAQEKYDRYLRIFLSTPKSKHPSMIQEDSRHLYAVRKEYLHISLLLVMELTGLGNILDKTIIKLSHDVWKKKRVTVNDNDYEALDSWKKIQKIKSWSDSYSEALSKIEQDMLAAKNQVEESSYLQFAPSMNSDDYAASMVNAHTLAMTDETSVEKHGYLFMKTSGKKSKPTWVKRWVFIKNGVFGLLLLSPCKTYVQESDKIGVLLCNVKYTSNEDRRFCFEVKTIDQTIVFQAETFNDLKSWLKVFENERMRVFQEAKDDPSKKIIASGRYPPMITELASTINSVVDRELTNTMLTDLSNGQVIASSSLSSHLESNQKAFENHVYLKIPQMKPPFMTSSTKSSILAYSIVSPTSVPTALTANIWGSVNWGLYHMNITNDEPVSLVDQEEEDFFLEDNKYPNYYPMEWISMDIEMRALFETAIGPNEVCLFCYRCLWAPNSKQELNGNCYITTKNIYFYLQALGFSCLNKFPISSVFSVDFNAQNNFDYLKLYNINGIIKLKLYLDEGKLIKQKFSYLINNNTKQKPDKLPEIIRNLKKIERDFEYEARHPISPEKMIPKSSEMSRSMFSTSNSFSSSEIRKKTRLFQINFEKEGKLLFLKKFPVPPKVLFHALLGENSIMTRTSGLFIHLDAIVKKPWSNTPEGNQRRYITVPISYRGKPRGSICIEQNVFNSNSEDYFTFTFKKSRLQFFLGSGFALYERFVIVEVSGKQSEVYIYGNILFDKWLIFNPIIDVIASSFRKFYFYRIDSALKEVVSKVGSHGIVSKAIYLYGKLIVTNEKEPEKNTNDSTLYLQFRDVVFLIIEKQVLRYYEMFFKIFTFLFESIVRLVVSLKMNMLLVFIIAISVFFNIFLSSKAATSYWSVRRANQAAQEYVNSQQSIILKAIYLKDLSYLSQSQFLESSCNTTLDSRCFNTFKDVSFVMNENKLFWDSDYGDEETRAIGRNLMKTYHEIGIKRNELLIKLKMLNQLEEEVGRGEWLNWLSSELNKCSYFKYNMIDEDTRNSLDNKTLDEIKDYCDSCYQDHALMGLI